MVMQAQDIHDIRSYLSELMAEFWPDKKHPAPKIIAKIESTGEQAGRHAEGGSRRLGQCVGEPWG